MTIGELLKNLCSVGYELWISSLCGGSQNQRERFARMDKPQIGDVVFETTAGVFKLMRDGDFALALGYLIETKQEPYPRGEGDPVWDVVVEGRPEPLEEVVYIKRLDTEEVVRWVNAKFITIIPTEGWK